MGKGKIDPQPSRNPWTDRHQIWTAWLRRGLLRSKKIWAQSVQRFLLSI